MNFKRGLKNVFFGFLNLILTSAVAIIVPRLVINSFGSEVNGLVSSITQIFAYFTLLEAGVGLASLQALYGPVGKKDHSSINRIISATHRYYKKTAFYYLMSIFVFILIYSLLVKTSVNIVIVIILIFINGFAGLMNVYFQAKYKVLLEAEGKNYVLINLLTATQLMLSIGRIIVLILGFNIIVVQSLVIVVSLIQSAYILRYIKMNYPWLSIKESPDYSSISQKKSVLVHQISGVIFNNTDILFLTVFTDLKVVSVYALYNMIYHIVKNGFNHISSGVLFAFGQMYHTHFSKFKRYFEIYEVYYIALVFGVGVTVTLLIYPFMSLYTQGITDIEYLDNYVIILFSVIMLLLAARTPSRQVIDIAGHFTKTQNRAVIESAINLTFTLLLVSFYGIYGVLLGTVAALIYRSTDMILYANKIILSRGSINSLKNWSVNIILFTFIYMIGQNYMVRVDSYFLLMIYTLLLTPVMIIIFVSINSMLNPIVFKSLVTEIKQLIAGR